MVLGFLEGLRRRSKFVIAMVDYASPGEGSNFLTFKKGDLICLDQDDGYSVMHSGWCCGKCDRTGEEGDFPANCVYVLPAITKPSNEVLRLFQEQSEEAADGLFEFTGDAGDAEGDDDETYSLDMWVDCDPVWRGLGSAGSCVTPCSPRSPCWAGMPWSTFALRRKSRWVAASRDVPRSRREAPTTRGVTRAS